jgi:hypothetical protein
VQYGQQSSVRSGLVVCAFPERHVLSEVSKDLESGNVSSFESCVTRIFMAHSPISLSK